VIIHLCISTTVPSKTILTHKTYWTGYVSLTPEKKKKEARERV
jgi:hypothetical protein